MSTAQASGVNLINSLSALGGATDVSHWVMDAVSLANEVRSVASPLGLRAHSSQSVAASKVLVRGVSL